ncbi:MAG: Holliday junction branch migration protein RuvA [Verrucomicrobiota bacterium]
MISFLKGVLVESWPDRVVMDVRDVGYEIRIPASTFEKLPLPGESVVLQTVLAVRETEHVLYGFWTRQERDLYNLLVNHVTGIGPKMAISILSGCTPNRFQAAVAARDTASLSKIKGVGKKTAERIVVELQDKMGLSATPFPTAHLDESQEGGQLLNDAILALVSLGYKQPDAVKAIEKVETRESIESIVRDALKHL